MTRASVRPLALALGARCSFCNNETNQHHHNHFHCHHRHNRRCRHHHHQIRDGAHLQRSGSFGKLPHLPGVHLDAQRGLQYFGRTNQGRIQVSDFRAGFARLPADLRRSLKFQPESGSSLSVSLLVFGQMGAEARADAASRKRAGEREASRLVNNSLVGTSREQQLISADSSRQWPTTATTTTDKGTDETRLTWEQINPSKEKRRAVGHRPAQVDQQQQQQQHKPTDQLAGSLQRHSLATS